MNMTNIIIVQHNEVEHTIRCINSIYAWTPENSFRLFLVNNGSTDSTEDLNRLISNIDTSVFTFISERNKGFAGGNNIALECIQRRNIDGDILLLNNDTIVQNHWLEKLQKGLESPYIGAVGPVSNNVSGPQKVAPNFLPSVLYKPTDRLVGFCLLIKREVFDKVGLLDEQFGIGTYEDDDYCRRIQELGYSLRIVQDCYIEHVGSATLKAVVGENLKKLMSDNQKKFVSKYKVKDSGYKDEIEKIKVSVIVPCYNYGRFLDECLQSILTQTHKNIEVIVVNDASDDCTTQVLTLYKEGHNVRVITNPTNMGRSYSRNIGIQEAQGTHILCVDADDTIEPTCIEAMLLKMCETGSDIVYCGVNQFGDSRRRFIYKYTIETLIWDNGITVTSLFKKAHWEEIGGFDKDCPGFEDWEFWVNMAAHGHYAVPVIEYLLNYRRHGASWNTVDKAKYHESLAYIQKKHKQLFDKYPIKKNVQPIIPVTIDISHFRRAPLIHGKDN